MKPQLWEIPQVQVSDAHLQAKFDELTNRLKEIKRTYSKVKFAPSLAAEDMLLPMRLQNQVQILSCSL